MATIRIDDVLDVFTRLDSWRWIVERYLPNGPVCPRCSTKISGERALAAFWKMGRVYCSECRSIFRARAVSPLAGTEWQPEQIVKLLFLQNMGRKHHEIADRLDKSEETVRDMLDRIESIEAARSAAMDGTSPVELRVT